MNYYQRLKQIREERNITQAKIAEVLEIKQTHYSRYELGKVMMGIDKYILLAKFYNISIDYLAGIVDYPKTLDEKSNTVISNNGNGNVNITGYNSGTITVNGGEK